MKRCDILPDFAFFLIFLVSLFTTCCTSEIGKTSEISEITSVAAYGEAFVQWHVHNMRTHFMCLDIHLTTPTIAGHSECWRLQYKDSKLTANNGKLQILDNTAGFDKKNTRTDLKVTKRITLLSTPVFRYPHGNSEIGYVAALYRNKIVKFNCLDSAVDYISPDINTVLNNRPLSYFDFNTIQNDFIVKESSQNKMLFLKTTTTPLVICASRINDDFQAGKKAAVSGLNRFKNGNMYHVMIPQHSQTDPSLRIVGYSMGFTYNTAGVAAFMKINIEIISIYHFEPTSDNNQSKDLGIMHQCIFEASTCSFVSHTPDKECFKIFSIISEGSMQVVYHTKKNIKYRRIHCDSKMVMITHEGGTSQSYIQERGIFKLKALKGDIIEVKFVGNPAASAVAIATNPQAFENQQPPQFGMAPQNGQFSSGGPPLMPGLPPREFSGNGGLLPGQDAGNAPYFFAPGYPGPPPPPGGPEFPGDFKKENPAGRGNQPPNFGNPSPMVGFSNKNGGPAPPPQNPWFPPMKG